MIRTLIKKEFRSMWRSLFVNTKTGKKEKKAKTVFLLSLYVALALLLFAVFFVMAFGLSEALVTMGLGWFYFAFIGILATALGIFGDVFNTHSMMYGAKDNDLLFSLPIRSGDILFSRILVVFITGGCYMGLVFIPGIVAYWVASPSFSFPVLLMQIVVMASLALIVTTLTCALGWVIQKVSVRMKNRNAAKLILTIIFLGLYYFVSTQATKYIETLILNADKVSSSFRSVHLLYALGAGCTGSLLDCLIFTLFSALLFFICFRVISRSYLSLSTETGKSVKKTYSSSGIRALSSGGALLKREGMRFLSSTVYALNTGMGIIFMLIGAVALLIWRSAILSLTSQLEEMGMGYLVPLGVSVVISLLVSMNGISAPSVSLEGKSIWIVQSLPVSAWDVLKSKLLFCFILSAVPALILVLVAYGVSLVTLPLLPLFVVYTLLCCILQAETGLVFNLLHPSLKWTNEASCVKNGLSTFLALFTGWGVTALFGFVYFKFLSSVMSFTLYLCVFTSLLLFAAVPGTLWLKKKGAAIFQYLS